MIFSHYFASAGIYKWTDIHNRSTVPNQELIELFFSGSYNIQFAEDVTPSQTIATLRRVTRANYIFRVPTYTIFRPQVSVHQQNHLSTTGILHTQLYWADTSFIPASSRMSAANAVLALFSATPHNVDSGSRRRNGDKGSHVNWRSGMERHVLIYAFKETAPFYVPSSYFLG